MAKSSMNEPGSYSEVDGVRRDAQSLKHSASELARHVYTDSREALSAATMEAARRMEGLKESSRDQLQRLEVQVRENPGQSLAIAFAAGLIASFIFGRR